MISRVPAFIGAAALGVLVLIVLAAAQGSHGYRLQAVFTNVDGLTVDQEVQIHGARVGKVTKLTLNPDDTVTAELEISRRAAPVGRDARAVIKAKNLLGTKFVEVVPGDRRHPAPAGLVIPTARSRTSVDLDQVLDVLDPDTRTRLRILINQFGQAVTGRGADLSRLLTVLPSSFDEVSQLADGFSSDNRTLGRLIGSSDRLLAAVAERRRPLGALVDEAQGAVASTARRSRRLSATVRAAPATIAQLRRSLVQLQATAGPLRPAAMALRQSAAPLTATLRQLPPLQPTAESTLSTVTRVAPSLTTLARGAGPLVRRLRPTATRLANFATALDPVSSILDRGAVDIVATLEGWARATQKRDGVGHVFRGEAFVSPELATALVKRLSLDPAGARRQGRPVGSARPGGATVLPAPAPATPGAKAVTGPEVSSTVAKTVKQVQKTIDDVIGGPGRAPAPAGTPGQAQALLDFLLGP